jgi:phosphoribosyl-AMP cyclohydrolase
LSEAVLEAVRFDANGLVPAIAQQHNSGEVLMLAWMNRAALTETLATGQVCYFSRSRDALWRKGETSGQTQRLVELRRLSHRPAELLFSRRAGRERRRDRRADGGAGEPLFTTLSGHSDLRSAGSFPSWRPAAVSVA